MANAAIISTLAERLFELGGVSADRVRSRPHWAQQPGRLDRRPTQGVVLLDFSSPVSDFFADLA